jgi:hypothetical protein
MRRQDQKVHERTQKDVRGDRGVGVLVGCGLLYISYGTANINPFGRTFPWHDVCGWAVSSAGNPT